MKQGTKDNKEDVAEDSVPLRIAAGLAVSFLVLVGCAYARASTAETFVYVWAGLTGSYISHQLRHKKSAWLKLITSAGLLLILGNFVEGVMAQMKAGKFTIYEPFLLVLIGLQALHTFELRTKSDINYSMLVGFGLLTFTALTATDGKFAYFVVAYFSIITVYFYYESQARARAAISQPSATIHVDLPFQATALLTAPDASKSMTPQAGNLLLPLFLVPLAMLAVFLALPRTGSLSGLVVEMFRHFQIDHMSNQSWISTADLLPPQAGQKNVAGQRGDSATPGSGAGVDRSFSGSANGSEPPSGTAQRSAFSSMLHALESRNLAQHQGRKFSFADSGGIQKQSAGATADDRLNINNSVQSVHSSLTDELILSVSTKNPTYLRRQCFDYYDGHQWRITNPGPQAKCFKEGSGEQNLDRIAALKISANLHATNLTEDITVESALGHIIPVPSIPQKLAFPFDPVTVDELATLRSPEPLARGTHYQVTASIPDYGPTALSLLALANDDQNDGTIDLANYLELPQTLSQDVIALARSTAGRDGNRFSKASRLCNYLRENYRYNLEASTDQIDSGSEIAEQLLFKSKSGSCGQFATAFVVMCRAAGVPARCVAGFSPGEYDQKQSLQKIRKKHAHAWSEVYLVGSGWVPFDPTPPGLVPQPMPADRAMISAFKHGMDDLKERFAPTSNSQSQKGRDKKDKGVTKGTSTQNAPPQEALDQKSNLPPWLPAKEAVQALLDSGEISWQRIVVFVLLVLTGVILVQVIQAQARQGRLSQPGGDERASLSTLLFLKVTDDLKKLKIDRQPSDTPADLLAKFAELESSGADSFGDSLRNEPELPALCRQFMDLYCQDRFGPEEAPAARNSQLKQLSDQIHTLAQARRR